MLKPSKEAAVKAAISLTPQYTQLAGCLETCGHRNFRWHDLRHTWASWLAQQGTPLNVLQELGGWESETMVKRYAHLAPAQLTEHAERVSNLLNGTNMAQTEKQKG